MFITCDNSRVAKQQINYNKIEKRVGGKGWRRNPGSAHMCNFSCRWVPRWTLAIRSIGSIIYFVVLFCCFKRIFLNHIVIHYITYSRPIISYQSLSEPIRAYPSLSEPIRADSSRFEPIRAYPSLSEPIRAYPSPLYWQYNQ